MRAGSTVWKKSPAKRFTPATFNSQGWPTPRSSGARFPTLASSKSMRRRPRSLPGVIATLTRDDIKEFAYKYGATYKDQSIVAVEKVRYVGDPVAAVLAEDPEIGGSTPWTLSKSNTKSCPRLRILKKRLRPVLSRFTRAAWRARNCAARFMARRKDSRGRIFVITSASVGAISIKASRNPIGF